jgi:predicted O-linked N-acetylglucosamine transferase (SPINDLY family)
MSQRKDNTVKASATSGQTCLGNVLAQLSFSKDGLAELKVPRGVLPDFLIRANDLANRGHIEEAIELVNEQNVQVVLQKAEHDPRHADVMFMVLAVVFQKAELPQEAVKWYEKILEHNPNPLVLNELAGLYQSAGRRSQAMKYRKQAMGLEPDNTYICGHYAADLIAMGDVQQGLDLLREIMERDPTNPLPHSMLLWRMHYLPDLDRRELFAEHMRWGKMHAPSSLAKASHDNTPDPDRWLRVGYISADFRMHSVAYNFEAFLSGRSRDSIEVYGYANVSRGDEVTARFERQFDHYRNICGLTDEELVRLIGRDKIDILVALGGHTDGNRLLALARKPAPIQVDYGGINTSGMEQIDYRLTDVLLDPPQSQELYVEELVHLPGGLVCYTPPDFAPPMAPLPAERNGFTTYGSFNGSAKVNSYIMSLWAQVLRADTDSVFLMKFAGGEDPAMRDRYWRLFEQFRISRDRVEICGWKPSVEHLRLYDRVDIVLDTYPYNGCLTTLEGLWMGVPTISLIGDNYISRVGLSILSRIGLEFFAASTPEEYVRKAIALAGSRDALAKIRVSLRQRMIGSELCDPKRLAREAEAAYRMMWHRWCQSQNDGTPADERRADAKCLAGPKVPSALSQVVDDLPEGT